MSEDQINQFLMITGSENNEMAKQFIEMADGNLEVAISIFFENGGNRMAQAQDRRNSNTNTTRNANSDSNFHSNSNSGTNITANTESDAELAQRLQNEAYQQGPNVGSGISSDDTIRAPDQAIHETLADTHIFPGTYGGIGGSFGPLRRTVDDMFDQSRPTGVFNQRFDSYTGSNNESSSSSDEDAHDDDNDDDDDDNMSNDLEYEYVETSTIEIDDDGELHEHTKLVKRPKQMSRERKLELLFRPPFDIMSKRDFESAKRKAVKKKKWLMINIQDSGIFQCQALNRDLWSSKAVKKLIKSHFVFLQYQFEARDATPYINFYNLHDKNDLPHIGIIDPITGERMKQWDQTVPEVTKFITDIKEFLSAFSMDPSHQNPIVKQPEPKVDPSTLSEEQQLQIAIKESLDNDANSDNALRDDNNNHIAADSTTNEVQANNNTSALDPFTTIQPIAHEEPQNKPGITTRIQIRTGDGRRIVRRFTSEEDSVRTIFEVVKTEIVGFETVRFMLTDHNRENLIEKLDLSISDAGLKNSSLLLAKEEDEDEEADGDEK
ncbi:hypothetical protein TBLA_0H01840 [Henningerozyma blattae CBS 6284]|uniref:UBX domain-containing protein n=1 Tax=Henningerozyma blattae (strain ATCC 34711 / CBS 6284 / DSM 70876 / NBRC 10599 / NRRL Y-10934 / UCD 77-7) TaxID=1071380 RepID=I2H7W9_HENB6|nr:hypothetical protein TBLA_0H01840 [Tetrapisispora blattae CBS 6284]CCH62471.1 hypothetical protein TBLA_0H01840 [Tetrapisispora blattae CBS 6284]